MFPTALEKEEACFGAANWLCVARMDETAQAPVSDLFPLVSDRAGIERGSVFWSSELDLRGQRKGTSTGAVSECAGMKRGSVLWKSDLDLRGQCGRTGAGAGFRSVSICFRPC